MPAPPRRVTRARWQWPAASTPARQTSGRRSRRAFSTAREQLLHARSGKDGHEGRHDDFPTVVGHERHSRALADVGRHHEAAGRQRGTLRSLAGSR